MADRKQYRCVVVILNADKAEAELLFQNHYDDQCTNVFHRKVYVGGVHRAYVASFPLTRKQIVKPNGDLRLLAIPNRFPRSVTVLGVQPNEKAVLRKLAIAAELDIEQYKGDPTDPARTHGYVKLITGRFPSINQIVGYLGGTLKP